MEYTKLTHPFGPLFDEHSRVLILGSFPSVKSREMNFFYGHPRNRFWPLIALLTGSAPPADIPAKRELILQNHLALWDVIASCEIRGSSDSSIRNAVANDLSRILGSAPIGRIYTNGSLAGKLYEKYQFPVTGIRAVTLPSTSPANAAWSLERLAEAWRVVTL